MTVPIVWVLSLEDILTTFALIVLGLELWRSTAPTLSTARHQVANLMLFVLAVLEMAIVPWCRSGTFFTLTLASLITLIDATFVAFITKGTTSSYPTVSRGNASHYSTSPALSTRAFFPRCKEEPRRAQSILNNVGSL